MWFAQIGGLFALTKIGIIVQSYHKKKFLNQVHRSLDRKNLSFLVKSLEDGDDEEIKLLQDENQKVQDENAKIQDGMDQVRSFLPKIDLSPKRVYPVSINYQEETGQIVAVKI